MKGDTMVIDDLRRRGSSSTIIQIFGAYGHVARGCYLPGLFTCLGSGPLKDSLEWTSSLDDHPSSRPKKDEAERASCEGLGDRSSLD